MSLSLPERIRVIPTLLLKGTGLVKTVQFRNPKYVGDPINAVKIFNDKEVDELVILDIEATKLNREPNYELLQTITSEAFMPVAYGGGINNLEQIRKLFSLGIEKVVLNTAVFTDPELVSKAAKYFGCQSIVVSIDARKNWVGSYTTYCSSGKINMRLSPPQVAVRAQEYGAGEIVINSIDRDGTYRGYDIQLIRSVADSVSLPVIALGGARNISDFCEAIHKGNASAVSAGSVFVFQGVHRAVLISFPSEAALTQEFFNLCRPFTQKNYK